MATTLQDVAQAEIKLTGKRYCTGHRGMVALDAGSLVARGKTRRWICFRCQHNAAFRVGAKQSAA